MRSHSSRGHSMSMAERWPQFSCLPSLPSHKADTEINYVPGACLCDSGFPRHTCLHAPLTLLHPADSFSPWTPAVSLPDS